jgi:ATP-dependent DNA ligase
MLPAAANQARWLSPDRAARRQRVRLFTPATTGAIAIHASSRPKFVVRAHGEAVLLGTRHFRFQRPAVPQARSEVQLCAFDVLAADGDDLRRLPLSLRKINLARILARRVDGIHIASFEQGEIGPDLFRHACKMGLEGLLLKHRDRTYRSGRFDRWLNVKNREHPALAG